MSNEQLKLEMEGIVQIQIDDLLLSVDVETANQLENDMQFRQQYISAIRRQLLNTNTTIDNGNANAKGFSADTKNKVQPPNNTSSNVEISEANIQPLWTSSKNQREHDRAATLFFLHLRKKYSHEFQDKITNKNSIWSKIAAEMNSANFFIGNDINGREKCRQKFANLQASYVRFIDRRRQTGEGKIPKPPFFDDLDEILGDKHKIEPVLIIDSEKTNKNSDLQPSSSKAAKATFSQSSTLENAIDSSEENYHSTKGENKFTSVKNSVSPDKNKLLQKFIEVSQENAENNKKGFAEIMSFLREEGERRHQQIMGIIEAMNPHRKRKRGDSDSD